VVIISVPVVRFDPPEEQSMTPIDDRVACSFCGQDWQTWYRILEDHQPFLLCPECEAIWLPDDDRYARPVGFLPDLFRGDLQCEVWNLIEPCGPPEGRLTAGEGWPTPASNVRKSCPGSWRERSPWSGHRDGGRLGKQLDG
jgi:hypothetical protein